VKRIHLIISGRVQGVGFRYFCLEQAERLGITGHAQNRSDGSVEVEAQGTEEKLEQFATAVSIGPRQARITNIEREDGMALSTENEFHIH